MTSSPSIHTLISNYYTTKPNFATFISSSDTLTTQIQNLQISTNMPVHPAEEIASGSITDQVAKESKDSTASSAPLHQEDTGATSGGSMDAQQAHKANPGPVMAADIGKPASKEELKKRAEELNQK